MNYPGLNFLWLLPLGLLGCASAPPAPPSVTHPAQAEHAPFVMSGRIAVKHDGGRSSATVRWTHSAGADEILLFAPLGQTVARIHREGQRVMLDTPDKHYVAQDAGELTQQVLGWRLPLSDLQYWILALPAPAGTFDIERDGNGQISILWQHGWTVSYTRYATPAPDSLPLRLVLQREGLEIQLLIDEWEMPSPP